MILNDGSGARLQVWDELYMRQALAAKSQSTCIRNQVGAVLVLKYGITIPGHNGTPDGMKSCMDGGCYRCAKPKYFPPGQGYDICLCVHAEQSALLRAAQLGISVAGATVYSTMRPCFGCSKELVQAGVLNVVYLDEWRHKDKEIHHIYERMNFPLSFRRIHLVDREDEPLTMETPVVDEHGHSVGEADQYSLISNLL
jgi:dCMP deaminase